MGWGGGRDEGEGGGGGVVGLPGKTGHLYLSFFVK